MCFSPDRVCIDRGGSPDLHLYVCKRTSGDWKDRTAELSAGRKMETYEQHFRYPADDHRKYLCNCRSYYYRCADRIFYIGIPGKIL